VLSRGLSPKKLPPPPALHGEVHSVTHKEEHGSMPADSGFMNMNQQSLG
jgi:hypothetical protein